MADVPGQLWLLRHGETEWSKSGQHTGLTDIPLTANGEKLAAAWAPELGAHEFATVISSPLQRARRTAELAGVPAREIDADLTEWHYGDAEGRTTAEMQAETPGWDVWADGPPGGESLQALGDRCDRVLAAVADPLQRGDVLLVAHGHVLRVLTARYLTQPPGLGAHLRLEPASVAVLGHEHDRPALLQWGRTPAQD